MSVMIEEVPMQVEERITVKHLNAAWTCRTSCIYCDCKHLQTTECGAQGAHQ